MAVGWPELGYDLSAPRRSRLAVGWSIGAAWKFVLVLIEMPVVDLRLG